MIKPNAVLRFAAVCTSLLLFGGISSPALAISAAIGWNIPLNEAERYTLEVAADPGFGQIVLTQEVRGASVNVDLEKEGVYHWRLAREIAVPRTDGGAMPERSSPSVSEESSTFVSGSFALIDAAGNGPVREHAARLSWPAVDGADRYKLFVSTGGAPFKSLIIGATSFVANNGNEVQLIEVVPFTGGRRTDRAYHFNPGLTLDAGRSAPPLPPPPLVPVAAATQPAPPPPAPLPAAAQAVEAKPSDAVEGRRRVYLIAPFGYVDKEKFEFQKLDLDFKSTAKKASGGGAVVQTEPGGGLVVNARAAYHEHKADVSDAELFGAEKMKVHEARYNLELAIGYDLLHAFDIPRHLLTLSVEGLATQVPMMPLRYASDSGVPPELKKRTVSLFGGGLSYGYFGSGAGGVLEGGYSINNSESAVATYGRFTLEFYPANGLVILMGTTRRKTTVSRCDPDASFCLEEGKVHTTVTEQDGFLGLGAALK